MEVAVLAYDEDGERDCRFLLRIGIPDEDILIDNNSRNTHENAVNSAALWEDVVGAGAVEGQAHVVKALLAAILDAVAIAVQPHGMADGSISVPLQANSVVAIRISGLELSSR